MKRVLLTSILFLVGWGLFLYPHAANYFSEKNASVAVQEYRDEMKEQDNEALKKEWEKAVAYNENLSGDPVHDPFVAGSGMAMADNYYEMLNLDGNKTMGYLTIPQIEVELPIYLGTSEAVLQKGVGHLEGSYMPVGGEGTHSVLTGHTGLANAKIFTDLAELKEGDLFYLHILDETLAYQVDQIKVVRPDETEELRRREGKDYCTLLTCTPYGINSHRLLVRGVRSNQVPEVQEEQKKTGRENKLTKEERLLLAVGLGTTAVMLVLIILTAVWVRRSRKLKPRSGHSRRKGNSRQQRAEGGRKYWWEEEP